MKQEITIYTDGSCSPNPGFGGWAAVLIAPHHNDYRKEISGAEANSTNNQMELTAAIKGLDLLKFPCKVNLYTDSKYLQNAFNNHWLEKWQKKGWRTASGSPVLNQEFWKQLLAHAKHHEIRWHWVKGHADNEENNRCDELAVEARRQLQNSR